MSRIGYVSRHFDRRLRYFRYVASNFCHPSRVVPIAPLTGGVDFSVETGSTFNASPGVN